MTLPVLLGVDVGTARVKAVAVGLEGGELAHVDQPTPWVKHGVNIEMDPEELARVIRAVVADASGKAAADRSSGVEVVGIGVAGMGEAGVLVDRQGSPLNRIVGWHDPRGDVDTIRREIGLDAFHRAVGMPLNAQPSLAKIIWLQRANPGLAGTSRFLSIPEWAVVCLGGLPVSEFSLASRTGLLDLGEAAPFAGAVALLGRNLLSEIVVAGTPAGKARHEALPAGVRGAVLTVAGHDHQVAALAVGAARPKALFNSMGSAESLARCVEGPLDPAAVGRLAEQGMTVGWGVVSGRMAVLGGLRTGLFLEEFATLLGAHDRESRRRLSEEALLLDPADLPVEAVLREGDTGLVPGLLAEGFSAAVIWAAAVRDLTARSTQLLARMSIELGPHQYVTVAGGWARNGYVVAEKRRQLGEITVSTLREAGSTGAALLAGVAADIIERPETDPSPIWSARAVVPRERGFAMTDNAAVTEPDPSVTSPASGVPALAVHGLTKSYGHVRALRGVSFEAYAGEVTALVGDNGAGKSTMIKCIAGVVQPDGGTIEVNGVPITMTDPEHATQLGIETVYQDLALAPDLDAAANVFLGREVRRLRILHNHPEMRRRTARSFQELGVGMVQDMRVPVASFSGGQRQSVAIARAAMWAKHVIVMDEPTAALGVIQTQKVLELIERVRDRGLAVVFVSHNLPQVMEVADRIEVMRLGARVARFRRGEADVERLIAAISGAFTNEVLA